MVSSNNSQPRVFFLRVKTEKTPTTAFSMEFPSSVVTSVPAPDCWKGPENTLKKYVKLQLKTAFFTKRVLCCIFYFLQCIIISNFYAFHIAAYVVHIFTGFFLEKKSAFSYFPNSSVKRVIRPRSEWLIHLAMYENHKVNVLKQNRYCAEKAGQTPCVGQQLVLFRYVFLLSNRVRLISFVWRECNGVWTSVDRWTSSRVVFF